MRGCIATTPSALLHSLIGSQIVCIVPRPAVVDRRGCCS